MARLGYLIDPGFLSPLITALEDRPLTDLDLRAKFFRGTPDRRMSEIALSALLSFASDVQAIHFSDNVWRPKVKIEDAGAIKNLVATWLAKEKGCDEAFRRRCLTYIGAGASFPPDRYESLADLSNRTEITGTEWGRIISGSCDLRHITGRICRHSGADFLALHRANYAPPITDDTDVIPRIQVASLPRLPTTEDAIRNGILSARQNWKMQVDELLGDARTEDLTSFIAYAKDMLDYLLWGTQMPLRCVIRPEVIKETEGMLSRFGVQATALAFALRALPSTYRTISTLSLGVRFLSNNLSHPRPPEPDGSSFLKVCGLPPETQSAVGARRSGHSLLTLTRPLKAMHTALCNWSQREYTCAAIQDCAEALNTDIGVDKLVRRDLAVRLRRLDIARPIDLLDALANKISPPVESTEEDEALRAAAAISRYDGFFKTAQGRAYAEVRLAMHAELDFQKRFNSHIPDAPKRYEGIWKDSIGGLSDRIESLGRERGSQPQAAG